MIYFLLKNFFFVARKSVIKNTYNKFKFILDYIKKKKINFNFIIFVKFFLESEVLKKKHYSLNLKKFTFRHEYNFSEDWFSINIPIWEFIIKKEFGNDPKLNYLEIGTFEGRSAIYICENYKTIDVVCVDPFDKYESIESSAKKQEMKKIYEKFKSNIKIFDDRISHHKITSSDFFKKNDCLFDIIYIDGSHYHLDVLNDFKNSLKFLKKGGIIIFDDFLWNYYEKINENPIHGILPTLSLSKNLQIISASNQLIIKKIHS